MAFFSKKTELVATVPAVGYFLHDINFGEMDGRVPVVAFLVLRTAKYDEEDDYYLGIVPMTATEIYEGQNYVLELPDGQFDIVGRCLAPNLVEAQNFLRESEEEAKRKRVAKK
jgi:hypothetical protein